jgi:hypothetical protein
MHFASVITLAMKDKDKSTLPLHAQCIIDPRLGGEENRNLSNSLKELQIHEMILIFPLLVSTNNFYPF